MTCYDMLYTPNIKHLTWNLSEFLSKKEIFIRNICFLVDKLSILPLDIYTLFQKVTVVSSNLHKHISLCFSLQKNCLRLPCSTMLLGS